MNKILTAAAAAATLALLTGCGSSYNSSSSSTAASTRAASSTATTSSASTAAPGVVISTKQSKLGTVLAAGPKQLTVYLFEADRGGASACSAACAKVWPPVTASGAPSIAGQVEEAGLSTITRSDGTKQVTYKGHPLYFYDDDKDAEDAYGQGSKSFGAEWYALNPSGAKIDEN